MNRDNFDEYNDPSSYFIKEDALRSLDYDIYFSLGKRYFCDAGCHVCYIKDNLKQLKPNAKSLYPPITESIEQVWYDVADYFGSVRVNDDLFWLQLNAPHAFEWYVTHSPKLEYCMTDNAIFRQSKILHLFKFKAIADISLSSEFVQDVGSERILQELDYIRATHKIKKIKFIDCGHPELFAEFIEWAKKYDMHNCLHHDFRTDERKVLNYNWAEYQNTWVENHNSKLLKIYRESIALYYDDFYYSCDDASDINIQPFTNIEQGFDSKTFMIALIDGKLKQYNSYKDVSQIDIFKNYFTTTQHYKTNKDYNFIPNIMFSPTSRFMHKLIENGWIQTKYGLFQPGSPNVIGIVEKK